MAQKFLVCTQRLKIMFKPNIRVYCIRCTDYFIDRENSYLFFQDSEKQKDSLVLTNLYCALTLF